MSDHKTESERIMSLLNENVIAIEGQTDATMIATAIDALRHATLYAAEQQRIANLIALARVETENTSTPTDAVDAIYERGDDGDPWGETKLHTSKQIREGLGL